MPPLQPIPTPFRQWWREFCVRIVPIVAFLTAIIATVFLWKHQGGGRSLVAMGEGARAGINAPQPGAITEILAAPYSQVRKGDPIAVFRAFDPRADLDRKRLELDQTRVRNTPSLAETSAVDLERLRLDLARIRSELATARVRLDFASREVQRIEPLFRERLISETAIELSRANRDTNAAEVREKERLMLDLESRLQDLELRQALLQQGVDPASLDSDPNHPHALHETGTPDPTLCTLNAPIDGVVGSWLKRPGEFVPDGEPLLFVHGQRAERLVGYLRQPIHREPEVGTPVQIARRTIPRQRFTSVVLHVGSQFETITNALSILRDGVLWDVGLPLVIDVPPDHLIRPGEIVDITLLPPPVAAQFASAP